MDIPQCSPKENYLAHQTEIDAAIDSVLQEGVFIHGVQVRQFEKEFATFVGTKYAIAVGNGTQAIEIALRSLGVGPGDRVVTVSHTAVATVSAICSTGAIPVLLDCDEGSYTMNPELLAEFLKNEGDRIRAVVVVHLYGMPADIALLGQIAEQYGIPLIEDCAQAHGARYGRQQVGTFGKVAGFSFYPTKNLGALGDGGMIVTNDYEVWTVARELREYGWHGPDRVSVRTGMNSRLDELQAAILRVKLKYLLEDNSKRAVLASKYEELLGPVSFLQLPDKREEYFPAWHQYVVRSEDRDSLHAFLAARGIGAAVHYRLPAHLHPAFARIAAIPYKLIVTEKITKEILSLPMFPELALESATMVAKAILEWRSGRAEGDDYSENRID